MSGPVLDATGDQAGAALPCCEETMTTQHGRRLDWSVPRFCNRAKGHSGEHVYNSSVNRGEVSS